VKLLAMPGFADDEDAPVVAAEFASAVAAMAVMACS
jgi:hypothetical protein